MSTPLGVRTPNSSSRSRCAPSGAPGSLNQIVVDAGISKGSLYYFVLAVARASDQWLVDAAVRDTKGHLDRARTVAGNYRRLFAARR